ncbi:MAG: hypothetical protein AAF533_01635 [Acidobacteriota bacterium]
MTSSPRTCPRLVSRLLATALVACVSGGAFAAPPTAWEPRGIGGGGALFEPSWSPHLPDELWIACDVTQPFHTTDAGRSWVRADFRQLLGGYQTGVRFSSDPQRLYALASSPDTGSGHPQRSLDGGATWDDLPANPVGEAAWSLHVDPRAPGRLITTSYTRLYYSADGGDSFTEHHEDGGGAHVAGVHWDGDDIVIGLRAEALVSDDGGTSFTSRALTGIPGDENVVSFAGASDGVTTRLFAVTLGAGDVFPGVRGSDHWLYRNVYVSTDLGLTWTASSTGIGGGDHPFFVATTPDAPGIAWLAGGSDRSEPVVYRTTDGGASWQSTFDTVDNANIRTGWSGAGGDRGWGYGELAFGFAVSPIDSNRAVFTDFGFAHLTTDGGVSWSQAYVDPADENPAGSRTPQRRSYASVGLENTTHWHVTWSSPDDVFVSTTDIRGIRSTDGGERWSFDYTGHTLNTMYHVVRQESTGTLFGATGSVHDMYQSTYLLDSRIDRGTGEVLSSTDAGATWELVHDFGHPVVWLALDPTDDDRAWASVVHSFEGGIWTTDNLSAGAASNWVPLSAPPRTEGHPFNIFRLDDGTLVTTFCGRRDPGGAFTESSGVFVSEDGGVTWLDRSDGDMRWWTKDITVDPHDPTQSTWYAGVWSGWGGPPNDRGGLFRTTDRGVTWTRIVTSHRISGAYLNPNVAGEGWYTTEVEGLWFSENLGDPVPTWTEVNLDIPHPERVIYNPHDPAEVWVTTFGSGLFVGRTDAVAPVLLRNAEVTSLAPLTPALATVLPLDPVEDLHVASFTVGELDPETRVVDDATRPLVFYSVDADVTIRLTITPERRLRIDW